MSFNGYEELELFLGSEGGLPPSNQISTHDSVAYERKGHETLPDKSRYGVNLD